MKSSTCSCLTSIYLTVSHFTLALHAQTSHRNRLS